MIEHLDSKKKLKLPRLHQQTESKPNAAGFTRHRLGQVNLFSDLANLYQTIDESGYSVHHFTDKKDVDDQPQK